MTRRRQHGTNAKRAPELDGDRAHYLDGSNYDLTYAERVCDIPFYCELAKEASKVLYLGAGTGRIAAPVARHMKPGAKLTCVERMKPMLDLLKARLEAEAGAHLELAFWGDDFLNLELPQHSFDLVIAPFNVLMHVHEQEDQLELFGNIERALVDGGRFAFDVLMPDPEALLFDPAELFFSDDVEAWGQSWRYAERFVYDAVTQVQHIELHYIDVEDESKVKVVPLAHRQFFPQELRLLLSRFAIESHAGDFEGGELDEDSESQVLIARKTE